MRRIESFIDEAVYECFYLFPRKKRALSESPIMASDL